MSGLAVRGKNGELIKLEQLARVKEGVGPRQLSHFMRVRAAQLSAGLAPGFTLGEALDSLERIAKEVLPAGSTVALAGESRELRESGSSLYFAFLLALIVVFMVLASQFESVVHPFTVLMAVPLAVTGALFTLWIAGSTINLYSQIGMILLIGLVTKNSILLVDYTNQLREKGLDTIAALLEAGRIRLRPILMTSVATVMGAVPIALGTRRRLDQPPPAGLRHRGRRGLLHRADALPGAGGLLADGRPAGTRAPVAPGRGRKPGARGRGGMMLLLLAALAGPPEMVADSLPRITLAEALTRSARLDPNYVRALGQVDNAAWARRAARTAMVLPSIAVTTDYSTFSISQFNVGTGAQAKTSATARIDARFDLFTGFRKLADVSRTNADLEGAQAGEEQQRYLTALNTESDFYAVLSGRELLDVSRDRLRPRGGAARGGAGPGGEWRRGPDRLPPAGARAQSRAGGAPAGRSPAPGGAAPAGAAGRHSGRGRCRAARHRPRAGSPHHAPRGDEPGAGAGPRIPGGAGQPALGRGQRPVGPQPVLSPGRAERQFHLVRRALLSQRPVPEHSDPLGEPSPLGQRPAGAGALPRPRRPGSGPRYPRGSRASRGSRRHRGVGGLSDRPGHRRLLVSRA